MENKIIFFQETIHKAWTAEDSVLYKGWILRLSEGVTRRANSILPLRYFGENLIEDIKNVETIYESRNLPITFQVADYYQPEILVETLLSLGYESIDETIVMSRNLEDWRSTQKESLTSYITHLDVDNFWYENLEKLSQHPHDRTIGLKKIIERSPYGKVICYAEKEERVVGTVLGIIEDNIIGIYNLIVDKNYRREGIGTNIMIKTLNWAKNNGIKTAYLAVEKENRSAYNLYVNLGFTCIYSYKYFVKNNKQ